MAGEGGWGREPAQERAGGVAHLARAAAGSAPLRLAPRPLEPRAKAAVMLGCRAGRCRGGQPQGRAANAAPRALHPPAAPASPRACTAAIGSPSAAAAAGRESAAWRPSAKAPLDSQYSTVACGTTREARKRGRVRPSRTARARGRSAARQQGRGRRGPRGGEAGGGSVEMWSKGCLAMAARRQCQRQRRCQRLWQWERRATPDQLGRLAPPLSKRSQRAPRLLPGARTRAGVMHAHRFAAPAPPATRTHRLRSTPAFACSTQTRPEAAACPPRRNRSPTCPTPPRALSCRRTTRRPQSRSRARPPRTCGAGRRTCQGTRSPGFGGWKHVGKLVAGAPAAAAAAAASDSSRRCKVQNDPPKSTSHT